MKKIYTIVLFSAFCLRGNAQQDPQYSLYQFNQMILNPAYAGSREGFSAVASNRQQWVGFNDAPRTTCASIHTPIMSKNIGLGLTLTNDLMGPRDVTSIYANVAYMLKITNHTRLSFGLNAGYNRYQFHFDKITWKEGEAPSDLFSNQTSGTLDINGGLYLKSRNYFVGVSASHINNPSAYSYDAGKVTYKLQTHFFITAGYSFILDKDVVFAPTVLVKLVDGHMNSDINANFFLMKKMWLGAFYRTGYGPGMLFQYYITNPLRVGMSYDTGLQAARRLGPSFELMLGYDFAGTKAKMVNPRFL
ncbi:MAG: type IX secretion system membrane protein PorP/SprF [bacterium]|nr:type IX secretion system membrane protein PorP/SprF [bacterium]